MKKTIKLLEKQFIGTGEVKGFKFRQIHSTQHAYIYEVSSGDKMYYEIFKRVNSPICIDFEKRIYSETEFKESYPKASRFGIDAWSAFDLDKAIKRMIQITDEEITKELNEDLK